MSEMATTAAPSAPPLTKKGGATRKALLDSTITLLASTGYAATTTQAVLNHAGISRGSLLHQFRTRDLLMVAAALEAVERMFVGVQQGLAGIADPVEALRKYPDVLWEVQNQAPARAYAELQLASRWQDSLREALRPAVQNVNERISREFREVGETIGLTNVDRLVIEVGALISAVQGLAVSSSLMADTRTTEEILQALKQHYRDCLENSVL